MAKRLQLAASVVLLVGLASSTAHGIVAVKRDFPDLVARAEQIIIGTVTQIREGQDDAGRPATFVTFSDLSVLKGDVGSEFTLRLAGGSSGRYAVVVPDLPTFELGERAVLFIAGNGRDICPLVGVWQGRFRVRHDPDLGVDVVDRSDGQPVVGVRRGEVEAAPSDGGGAGATTPLSLDTFRQLVADELASPTKAGGN